MAEDPKPRRTSKWLDGFRTYTERRLLFVFVMGFASGLPYLLCGSTLSIWLTEIGVTLTAIGLFSLVGIPFSLKFVWAPLVDRVRLPFLTALLGQRRSWMLVIQVGLLLSIVALGLSNPETSPFVTAVCALVVAFFSASQDIVIDAYRIDILDDDQQGAGAAMTQAGYRCGLLTAGAGALYLASASTWPVVYVVMASLVLVGIVATLRAPLPERDIDPDSCRPAVKAADPRAKGWFWTTVIEPFVEFFRRQGVRMALLVLFFILLFKFGDSFAGVMANPFYVRTGFTKIQIANASKIFGVVATLLGVFAGGLVVKRFGILKGLLLGGFAQMGSNLMFAAQAALGANYTFLFFTIGVENFSGGLGSAAFVAYLSVLCDAKYSGTQFAMFTSLMALARVGLSAGAGALADSMDWVSFFVASTFFAVPGLLLLMWMIRRLPLDRQVSRQGSGDGD